MDVMRSMRPHHRIERQLSKAKTSHGGSLRRCNKPTALRRSSISRVSPSKVRSRLDPKGRHLRLDEPGRKFGREELASFCQYFRSASAFPPLSGERLSPHCLLSITPRMSARWQAASVEGSIFCDRVATHTSSSWSEANSN